MDTRSFDELDQARQDFLAELPPNYQGMACNYFLELPRRSTVDDPERVLAHVNGELNDRITRAYAYAQQDGTRTRVSQSLSNLEALQSAIIADRAGALIVAAWAIAYVALPEAQRQARRTHQREVWATESMRGKPATPKQLDYLKKLGYDGEVTDRRHASDLINNLTRS